VAGVVFVNPGSGKDGSPGLEEIAKALPELHLVELDDPGRLGDLVKEALADGQDPIAVAGGDGTIRCAAEVLAGTSVAFLPVPAGTRNHFAREVGLEDLDRVAGALVGGRRRHVTVGFVNDRAFVNNASIGLYPALVRRRERSSLSKSVAGFKAALQLLRHGQPIEIELDGEKLEAWLVFVGNGRYGEGFTDLIERESLDEGILDVRVIRSGPALSRVRVVIDTLLGRLRKSHLVVAREAASLSIGVEGRHLDVALDGEVIEVEAPLHFEARKSALTVMVPGGD
jgi:diacylglycerol kinase family enzyme